MGKFNDILLCSDLDDTLLTDNKRVSDENKEAIEYFKSEGGLFTFATGRIPHGAGLMLEYVAPNAPMVCFNGAGIYDFKEQRLLWSMHLDEAAIEVIEFVDSTMPFSGIEICTEDKIYFCKINNIVQMHKMHERLPDLNSAYNSVPRPWVKVLFMQEAQQISIVRETLLNSEFANRYEFIQSSPNYFELLPKYATKGNALLKLASFLNIPIENVIAMGDNENDIHMVKVAGTGIAVKNAIKEVRDAADFITVDNNSSAAAAVISALERGSLKINS